jgi:type VI secretion system secreted protein VgrG
VLAGSSVTNTGLTNVTFDPSAVTGGVNDDLIGVWPGTAVTGFYPPGTDADGPNAIYGAGYNADSTVPQTAQASLTTALVLIGFTTSTQTVAGDLSQATVTGYPTGTLPAGVYTSTSSLSISAGNLTLDGGGNPQSVFIFKMGSTLTTTFNGVVGGNVVLENGANACNVYWDVGSSATLAGTNFYGNVLAVASITIDAAHFTGRALAQNGTVTIPIAGGSLITNPGGSSLEPSVRTHRSIRPVK